MSDHCRHYLRFIYSILLFGLWSLLFAIAYAQSPLFTSNQNLYFLHGFKLSGFGYLVNDWLANTLDPAPVFSALVFFTIKYLQYEWIFYLEYGLLMGIYLFSFLGIGLYFFEESNTLVKNSNNKYSIPQQKYRNVIFPLVFLTLFFVMHSAGLRFSLSRIIGTNWAYILEDGVADQRMLGPVLQPSAWGVLLALSVYLFLRKQRYLAILSASLAAYFHPTYLLAVAFLTISYMFVEWQQSRNYFSAIKIGMIACIVVTPVLIFTLTVFSSTSSDLAAQARNILINFRIPHHAQVDWWLDATALIKLCMLATAVFLARRGRLWAIVLIPGGAAILLTIIQVIFKSDLLALLFPWRVSVLLVPLSLTLILTKMVVLLIRAINKFTVLGTHFFIAINLMVIFVTIFIGGVRFWLDLQRKLAIGEQQMFQYVQAQLVPGQVFLIPLKMQDFRLETGAPAYVDFKSHPYKDVEVIEWYRRVQIADGFYLTPECKKLSGLMAEGITHVVVPDQASLENCVLADLKYIDDFYQIYALKNP